MTHYDTLGVARTATPEEIKTAYRKLAKQHHPDLGGDITKFQSISEAYETLSDPDKKSHYDYQLKNPQSPYGFHFSSNFGDASDIFKEFSFIFGGGSPFQEKSRNKNIRINFEVPFLSTLNEQLKVVDINLTNGKETLELKIPAGVEDGASMTLRGKGDNEHLNLPRGNLEIIVRVIPDSKFYRQDNNIVTDITVNCFEAITGTEILLDTPDEKKINLNIPAGTQNNTVFGISDLGFPTYPKNTRGKLLIKINVLVPRNLTNEQLELVEKIQKLKPINS